MFCFFLLHRSHFTLTAFSLGMSPLSKYDSIMLHLGKLRQGEKSDLALTKEAVSLAKNPAKGRGFFNARLLWASRLCPAMISLLP